MKLSTRNSLDKIVFHTDEFPPGRTIQLLFYPPDHMPSKSKFQNSFFHK